MHNSALNQDLLHQINNFSTVISTDLNQSCFVFTIFILFQIFWTELDTALRLYEYLEKRIRPQSFFELEADLEIDPSKYLTISSPLKRIFLITVPHPRTRKQFFVIIQQSSEY